MLNLRIYYRDRGEKNGPLYFCDIPCHNTEEGMIAFYKMVPNPRILNKKLIS